MGWGATSAAARFSEAVRHHQAGQLREAEHLYRQALAVDPKHADSMHLLGVLAHQVGNHQGAIEMIGKALAISPSAPEFHYNIGLAYGALGRFEEAASHNARAIALRPDYAEAHLNLGNALFASGKTAEAISSYRQALKLRPDSPVVIYNLANALADAGRSDEAETHYRRAIALKPDYAEAYNNLGTLLMSRGLAGEAAALHRRALELQPGLVTARVNLAAAFRAQGQLDEAIRCYREVLAQNPEQPEVHLNLGVCLLMRQELREAAACFKRALALKPDLTFADINYARVLMALGDASGALAAAKRLHDAKETTETRALFFECFRDARSLPFASQYREQLVRAIDEPWGDPRDLAPLAGSLINADPALWQQATGRVHEGVVRDPLLIALIRSAPVVDTRIERFLTSARGLELDAATANSRAEHEDVLAFVCALASQCFLNEYVFACSDEENRKTEQLRETITHALRSAAPVSPHAIAVLASYLPLSRLDETEALLARDWPAPLQPVLTQQIREPRIEANLRAAMPVLTRMDDGVSQAVRSQYEENPYPRWTQLASAYTLRSLDSFMRERFPLSAYRPLGKPRLDYLIAGCGTGRQVAAAMQTFDNIDVTAIDLSLASLGYAKRKTDALGLKVDYGQADILELGSLGRKFDVVDSGGVLHHMRDPGAGWRQLVSLLRPNGLMRIALYSTVARKDVAVVRRFLAARNLQSTPDGIRRGRAALVAMPDGTPERNVTQGRDFSTMSECRDLLFHVEEHTFTLAEIGAFLDANGLKLIALDTPTEVTRQYAERFPDDPARIDLPNWDAFERDNPATFASMYQFWVQKSPA